MKVEGASLPAVHSGAILSMSSYSNRFASRPNHPTAKPHEIRMNSPDTRLRLNGGGKPLATVVLSSGTGINSNVRSTPDEPAFHIGAIHTRVFEALGYAPQAIGSNDAGALLREGLAFSRRLEGSKLAVVQQGYGTIAGAMRVVSSVSPRIIYHTWKVPFTGPARLTSRAMDAASDLVIRRAPLVILNSMIQQRMIAERYRWVPSIWIPVGVDKDWWCPGPQETGVLAPLGYLPGEFLMCVGDVDRDEDLPVALAQRLGRPLVRVTRDPNTVRRAKEAAAKAGLKHSHVLTGIAWRELRDLYRAAWAVLLAPVTSLHPAGLNGLTESMSCGAPVLFPNSPTPEGYVRSGENGMLYDQMTVDSIAAAAEVYQHPESRARISSAARLTCEQRLGFDAAAKIVVDRLRDLGWDANERFNA